MKANRVAECRAVWELQLRNGMYENDDLGTLADVAAGPFAGAFLHSREHYHTLDKVKQWAGLGAGLGETGHLLHKPPPVGEAPIPWGNIVEGGLSAADALNQGVHGDWEGAQGTLGRGLLEANGGLPGMFAHWLE